MNTSYGGTYFIFLEKPKVVKEPAKTLVLSSDGVVSHGSVTGADSVEWYTNAERIDSTFRFFKLLPSNDLKILPLSSGLAGFYQIIYRNNNGSVMRTVKVDIPNGNTFMLTFLFSSTFFYFRLM